MTAVSVDAGDLRALEGMARAVARRISAAAATPSRDDRAHHLAAGQAIAETIATTANAIRWGAWATRTQGGEDATS